MLRVGYKASAEQFAPGELAGYAVRAEELGLDSVTVSDHFQPWRLEGGHAPNSLAWMSWVLARTERVLRRHVGDDADLPLQPGRRGADLRDDGLPGTGPGHARCGHRRGAQRGGRGVGAARGSGPSSRSGSAGCARRCGSSGGCGPRTGPDLRGRVLPHRWTPRLRPPRPFRCRSTSRPVGRWWPGMPAASPTGSSAPRARVASCTPTSSCRPSTRGWTQAGRGHDEIDRMIEVKVSWDPDPERALENTRFWAPLSLTAEQKHSIHSPAEMERGRRRAADRAGRQALGRGLAARGGRRGAAGLHRPRVRPPRRARARARPGAVPLAPSPSRSSPACAS